MIGESPLDHDAISRSLRRAERVAVVGLGAADLQLGRVIAEHGSHRSRLGGIVERCAAAVCIDVPDLGQRLAQHLTDFFAQLRSHLG